MFHTCLKAPESLLWLALAEVALVVWGENLLIFPKPFTCVPIFDIPSSVLFILFVVNYSFGNEPSKQTSLIQKTLCLIWPAEKEKGHKIPPGAWRWGRI